MPENSKESYSSATASRLTPDASRLLPLLRNYWGHASFRPMQEEIMQSILEGKDVLALMPTGGGKSLCYQVPAMAKEGLCLVISPLIALMKDQVENLRKKGITAFAIYSGMKRFEVIQTLKTAGESNCKFLYVSPERLETALVKEYLPSLNVNLIAVDEAHCISQWGHDFRPPYMRIAALREELRDIPVLALTASATPAVQTEICDKLAFKQPVIFRQSFERANLSYSVFQVDSKINKLVSILNNVPGSSIVYCKSRRRTKAIAEQLQSYHISADYYHAGLNADERSKKQEAWIAGRMRTIVCTNAFGMGIDKPDVRAVVHIDMPDCLENYYQEAGRAGRDQKKSYAVLLYQQTDIEDLKEQVLLRFPGIETIRKIYQALANFLQLPAGSGEGTYIDFNISDFIQKFELPSYEVMNVLKVLEQEGFMNYNEQVFVSVRVQFVCSKQTLYQFEEENPALEPLIKMLLRSYEGIFDMPVAIFEKQISGWLKEDLKTIQQSLATLHRHRIISYEPQKDTPQLYIMQPRVRVEDISINQVNYAQRKKRFEDRIHQFVSFTANNKDCRSVIIGNYFGDAAIKPCGICDNCLARKKNDVAAEEFANIQHQIENALSNGALNIDVLLQQVKNVSKEKVWKVIDFLQAENKLVVNQDGQITKK